MLKPSNKRKVQPIEIVPVGNEDVGYFYLAKLGHIKAGERDQLTEVEVLRQQSTFVLNNLVSAIASDRKITKDEASALVFGKKDDASQVLSMAELHKFYPDETNEFLSRSNNQKSKVLVATLFLKGYYTNTSNGVKFIPGRSAHPFTVATSVKASDTIVEVTDVSRSIYAGQSIKFSNQVVTVVDNYPMSVDKEQPFKIQVQPLKVDLLAGDIGFLYSVSQGSYVLGDEQWSEVDTCELEYDLLEKIYDFYDYELSGWPVKKEEEEKPEEPTKDDAGDIPLEVNSQSVGLTSTTDSKLLELPTIA